MPDHGHDRLAGVRGRPEPPHHLDVTSRFIKQFAGLLASGRAARVFPPDVEHGPAAEVRRLVWARRDPDPHPGPTHAELIKRADRPRQLHRIGMGHQDGRDQPDRAGAGCQPGRDQYRVEPPAHLVGALILLVPVDRLHAERIFEGDEVESGALGLRYQVQPVTGREQLGRPGVGLAPGRRMPAGGLQCYAQVQRRNG